ncbi:hypothetical protein ACFUIZ_18935 [Streptomyces cinereoruber]|uniref:hypothetical protein n=1 Tax=Streptomyces cinereoruber TaxID=67260 RepID=UPI0036402DF0
MTTRARQASRHRLDLVISRLEDIAAGQAAPLTPDEAKQFAAIIKAHWSAAARDADDLRRVAIARKADLGRLAAAHAAIRELERDFAALRQTTTKEKP